jgi:ABC-type branched-subunit amino acid transport system ATPase component
MLRVDDLHAKRGDTRILHGINLQVDTGEIVALIGRNGMGKTTLLRAIIGLSEITSGSVTIDGADVTHTPTHDIVRRGIGVVLEDRGIFSNLTVEQNLRMGVRSARKKKEALARIYGDFPILRERGAESAGALSGGQQQLLAIARALVSQPRLLLIDEFSEGVQPNLVREICDMLQRLNKKGVSILLVEQNARLALGLSHRGYLLEKGRIVASGTSAIMNESILKHHLVI